MSKTNTRRVGWKDLVRGMKIVTWGYNFDNYDRPGGFTVTRRAPPAGFAVDLRKNVLWVYDGKKETYFGEDPALHFDIEEDIDPSLGEVCL